VLRYAPETRGMTLEQIDSQLEQSELPASDPAARGSRVAT
jgi:hypothetical protein